MTSRIRFVHRLGLWRSVLMYHAIPLRQRRLTRFYAQFIRPGDLCFDQRFGANEQGLNLSQRRRCGI